MRFKVIGQNRESGARMILEFEAESKGAAERKATQQGMSVNRVMDVTDGEGGVSSEPNPRAGRRGGGGGMLKGILIILIIAAIAWFFKGQILGLIHH